MAVKDMLGHFDPTERMFAAHIIDLFDQVDRGKGIRITCFCDLRQAAIVRQIGQAYDLYLQPFGGWADAERVAFVIAQNEWQVPDEPITAVLLQTYGEVSHRDVLGSVIGLGIKRESIGDIILTQSGQIVFAKPPADRVILSDLKRVGREAVKCSVVALTDVPAPIRNFRTSKGTVKSLRLDSVVSLCVNYSREKGKLLVEKELVTVDAVVRTEPAFSIPESCTISIRGHGKFLVACDGKVTAKGRYVITINKYI